ncbi:hypothetical protein TNCV_2379491 [Trichonephila clavipes]|uniref:Uncharacterized protein n=1 Tax=Trichonephila clavipes TaxID=2585209 RepID=A0A8X6UW02_TRICX|nr:hypothetical protein TNCV_2379491 [Trichonephila clavipes]
MYKVVNVGLDIQLVKDLWRSPPKDSFPVREPVTSQRSWSFTQHRDDRHSFSANLQFQSPPCERLTRINS